MIAFAKFLGRKWGREEAEDLAQELQILAWKKRGNPPPFIRQAMRWHSMEYCRRMSRRRQFEFPLESSPSLIDKLAGPDREVTIASLIRLIELNFLTPNLREHGRIFKKAVEGYTVREISGMFNLSRSETGRMLQTAKRVAAM